MKEDQQVRIEKNYNNQRCRDDAENQASINFDGNVYKCTAINITPDIREGVLNADGEIECSDWTIMQSWKECVVVLNTY